MDEQTLDFAYLTALDDGYTVVNMLSSHATISFPERADIKVEIQVEWDITPDGTIAGTLRFDEVIDE